MMSPLRAITLAALTVGVLDGLDAIISLGLGVALHFVVAHRCPSW
jgi:hypothetical protein